MGYGVTIEDGSLPVFAVGTKKEAKQLLTLACPTNIAGEFIAPELVDHQTLENLDKFSTRLDQAHERLIEAGQCECGEERQ